VRSPSFHGFIGAYSTVDVACSASEVSSCATEVSVASHPRGRSEGPAGDLVPELVPDVPHRAVRVFRVERVVSRGSCESLWDFGMNACLVCQEVALERGVYQVRDGGMGVVNVERAVVRLRGVHARPHVQ